MRKLITEHPLISHKLTALRDERTDSPTFRRLADELVTLLAYEATRSIRVEAVTVQTPVAAAQGVGLAAPTERVSRLKGSRLNAAKPSNASHEAA